MKKLTYFVVAIFALGAMQAHASQLFLGSAYFSMQPNTTASGGIIANTLTVTDTSTGFIVSGTVTIGVNGGTEAGTLLQWEVLRPLDPGWGSGTMTNTSSLTGWIDAPAGSLAASGTLLTEYTATGSSTAILGPFLYSWPSPGTTFFPPPPAVTTSPFVYTSNGTQFLRQRFDIDYSYAGSGPATYSIDFPAESITQPVPEPSTLALICTGAIALLASWRRSRAAPI
jgi:hypothetical protein